MTKIMVTGDKHIGLISDGMSRLDEQKRILEYIIDLIDIYKPDIYVDLGDLFDNSSPSPRSYKLAVRYYIDLVNKGLICKFLVGNHDKSSIGNMNALDPLNEISKDIVVYEPSLLNYNDELSLLLMPYITDNEARNNNYENSKQYYSDKINKLLKKCKNKIIGFSHLEVNGVVFNKVDIVQREVGLTIPEQLFLDNRLLRVYAGHIHSNQVLKNVTIVGSSIYVNFSESLDKKGIYLIEV